MFLARASTSLRETKWKEALGPDWSGAYQIVSAASKLISLWFCSIDFPGSRLSPSLGSLIKFCWWRSTVSTVLISNPALPDAANNFRTSTSFTFSLKFLCFVKLSYSILDFSRSQKQCLCQLTVNNSTETVFACFQEGCHTWHFSSWVFEGVFRVWVEW